MRNQKSEKKGSCAIYIHSRWCNMFQSCCWMVQKSQTTIWDAKNRVKYWDKLPFPQLVNCALQICNLPSMGDRIQISTKSIPPMCVLMSIIPLFCILHDTWQSMSTWSVTCRASHWPWRKSGWPPPRTAENQVDMPPNWSRVWLLYTPPCQ